VFDQAGRGSLDAWATISALAAVTERIRLGTMVSPATFRRPSVLSRMVATADHVSGGRVELGLGGGWNVREHEAHGFSFPDLGERMEILEEQLEIVHRQWTEEEFSFRGPPLPARPLPRRAETSPEAASADRDGWRRRPARRAARRAVGGRVQHAVLLGRGLPRRPCQDRRGVRARGA
jgi:alkanesulfonate monooxygenase SsuD/methylene tetrahydromethanopterin reductase-like flavin-dependent oxidoreductase (luciferase family)